MKKKLMAMVLALGAMFGAWADDAHDMVQLWAGGPYWATTNIGADKPEDYGYYFWWGDTVGYKWENEQWVASDGSSSNFRFHHDAVSKQTYIKNIYTLKSEGWITDDGVLAPTNDAAHVQWGGAWRMPTLDELNGLNNNCDWTWTTTNGVNGYLVILVAKLIHLCLHLRVCNLCRMTCAVSHKHKCYAIICCSIKAREIAL